MLSRQPLLSRDPSPRFRARRLRAFIILLCLAVSSARAAPLGQTIDDFQLRDFHGRERSLAELQGETATVLVFLGVECPLAKLYAPRLEQLARDYAARGVRVVGIDSNRQDLPTELAAYAAEHGITFPLLKDLDNKIADALGARRTPEVFLLDRDRVVRYHGRIDDQYQPGVQAARAKQHDLRAGIEQVIAGQSVSVAETPLAGCLIGRVNKRVEPPQGEPITWSKQVAPIFQKHCQECHRPGEIGPFPLLTYEDTQGWEGMIAEVVEQGRMPPWHANSAYGHFANDVSLNADEKRTILAWVRQGAPEGDKSELPAPAQFTDGWHIPTPDQVVYMSDRPFAVPAEGTVEYQWFVADPGFTEDKWIKAAECRPGNRAVVHHVTVYYKPPGVPFSLATNRRVNLLAGYAPGKIHYVPLSGVAFYLPKGSQLVFEMHYTPNGSPQEDRSSIGLVFAEPNEVEKQVYCVLAANDKFAIPPGDPDYRVDAQYRVDEDSLLYFLSPHMHLRGKSFRFDVLYPTGQRETLLDVPRFDFGWQTNFFLAEPKRLPKDSLIQCTARFDNSESNPVNPDPTATVRWGDQTWEEMMLGSLAIAPADQDLRHGIGVGPRSFDPSQWWYPQYTLAAAVAVLLLVIVCGASVALFFWRSRAVVKPTSIAGLLMLVLGISSASASPLGHKVDDFTLRDFHGHETSLDAAAGATATVLVFLGVDCPMAKLYAPRLEELSREFSSRGVKFVGIDSNRQDLPTELAAYAQRHGVAFPLLKDLDNKVADALGARRTPEVFVLDRERVVRYHGRIDDQHQPGIQGNRVARHDLREALVELVAGEPISTPETPITGCLIGRVNRQAEPPRGEPVVWSKQISRIFQERCQECHRPGEIGPFPLLTYEDTQGWEGMIAEVVEQGRMPPWHASPAHGHFVNDARLSDQEREQILDWVRQGAPAGDPADLPPARNFPTGWHLPKPPDQIVYMSDQPFDVPAQGTVDYQWFEADPGFAEDKWVMAAECRPGNRAVVHHVTVYYKPPGVPFSLKLGKRVNLLSGYAPGKVEINSEYQGRAFFLPAGTKLLFEMHYTPNGVAQQDRSSIGLLFVAPENVVKQMHCVLVGNDRFAIPPRAADYVVESSYRIDEDSILYSLSPHMHFRGRAFRFDLVSPDGRRETLLDVPRFEFGWQTNYQFVEPREVPRGSVVHCTAHFDNSDQNPFNPDPDATVRWGDQTSDEMMIGAIAIAPAHQDLRRGLGVAARAFDPAEWWYPQYTRVALAGAALLVVAVFVWLARHLMRARSLRKPTGIAGGLLVALWLGSSSTSASPLGQQVDDFTLRDYRGHETTLAASAGDKATVLVFLGVECPMAKLYAPRLQELAEEFETQGVKFVGLDPNRQDLPTELAAYAQRHGVTFPLLKDLDNKVADVLGARRTPEVFVLDRDHVVRYHGRIDDQYHPGIQGARAGRHDLRDALAELVAGKPVSIPDTPVTGCLIGRVKPKSAAPPGEPVTWSRQVSRIFQRHCQDCHRPGEIGPFPLLTYDDVQGWEDMIAEVVGQGRMPPWHANPEYGHFANDIRLGDDERQTILDWVAQGAPEGDPADLPPPVKFADGWHIPTPDQIVYMSEKPFDVPAEGTVEYQWFVADPGFTEDKWVKAAECRPGNRSVVHHVTVYYKPPDVPFELKFGTRINSLGGYTPGRTTSRPPSDALAFYLPRGTKLVFEVHYTPNGSPQQDRSFVGLSFADPRQVQKQLHCVLAANDNFTIPPRAADYQVESRYKFGEDTVLYALAPHMHVRGKSFRFDLVLPTGQRETLLDIPRYDFNWRTEYELAEPRTIPAGSEMHCVARFDNSADNPFNPNPDEAVGWGDQVWQEMMIGGFGISPAHQDLRRGIGVPARVSDPSQWWRHHYWAYVLAPIAVVIAAGVVFTWRRWRASHRAAAAVI